MILIENLKLQISNALDREMLPHSLLNDFLYRPHGAAVEAIELL